MSVKERTPPSAGRPDSYPPDAGSPGRTGGIASGMTLRAVGLGLFLSAAMAWWVVHSAFEAHSSYLSITHMPMAALFPFMLVVFVVNGLLKRFAPSRIFTAPELIIIFFIVFTASAIPGWAFTTYWVAVPSIPHYYANSENRYVELFFEYLPTWLIIPDERRAVHWFYEGLPSTGVIPWLDWIIPMSWWGTFFLALFFASASLMVILRKQWIERERLTFPLAACPCCLSKMTKAAPYCLGSPGPGYSGTDSPSPSSSFSGTSSRTGTPCRPSDWAGITAYRSPWPNPSRRSSSRSISRSSASDSLRISTSWFSIWVFLPAGHDPDRHHESIRHTEDDRDRHGSAPGRVFHVHLFGLWMARRHLYDVVRKAIGRGNDIDDSGEFFSYRTAMCGVVIGIAYMFFFLISMGMSVAAAATLLATCMLLFLGVTRVVAEAGLINLDLPYNAHDFTVFSFGSANLHRADLTILTLSQTFSRNWRTLGMCAMPTSNKMGDEIGGARRGIFPVIVSALVMAAIISVVYTVFLGYETTGADGFRDAFGNAKAGYNTLATWINNQTQLTGGEYLGLGVGAFIAWLLILAHHNFHWWPLHPIGWAVAKTWGIGMIATSIFLVWLAKAIIMKLAARDCTGRRSPSSSACWWVTCWAWRFPTASM